MNFNEIYNSYGGMVYNLCCRMTGQEMAEDLTQDIFLKIHESIGEFRHDSALSTWIYRIALNHCLNHIRREKLKNIFSLETIFHSGQEPVAPRSREPERVLDAEESGNVLHAAMMQLPPGQRTAIILQKFDNLSLKEIAHIMDASISSVESRLHKAKKNLGRILLHHNKGTNK